MKKNLPYINGFTLVELLVVISIIGLLASVVLTSVNSARNKAKVARAAADLRQLILVLNLYLDANGVYPCFDHTWDTTKEQVWSAPYIPLWPTPPWGNQYHWEHGLFVSVDWRSIDINAPGQANAEALDRLIDDGNLNTGIMRGSGTRLAYAGMDQSVPFADCHI